MRAKGGSMVVVALAALFGTAGCGQNAAEAPAQGGQALPVKLMTAKTQTVSESTRYVATLESRRSVNLQPRIDGQVTKLLVRAGDAVPAGAPLVQIDPKEQQAGVAGSTAAVAASRAALNSSEQQLRSSQAERTSRLATLRLQQQQYNRYTALLKEGAVSAQTVDEYRASLDSARASVAAIDAQLRSQAAQVKQARDALNQSQASLRQQQVQLDYYQIAAPFAGTVGYIPVKVGDYASTSTRLLTLTQNQPLDVNVAIPMEQASRLRKGTPVELLDERGTVVGESRVFFVAPNVDTGNQTVLVKALFPNTQNRLKADQLLQARVIWRRRAGLLVPASAVARVAGQDFVFVAQPNPKGGGLVAKQRPVTLGEIQGNDYQVASGVKPQEKVIVTGLLKLSDGVPIVPES